MNPLPPGNFLDCVKAWLDPMLTNGGDKTASCYQKPIDGSPSRSCDGAPHDRLDDREERTIDYLKERNESSVRDAPPLFVDMALVGFGRYGTEIHAHGRPSPIADEGTGW